MFTRTATAATTMARAATAARVISNVRLKDVVLTASPVFMFAIEESSLLLVNIPRTRNLRSRS
jgi:hypothetical protein